MTVTECEMINQFKGSATAPPQFTRGYGLTFGHCERKAMAMALVDRALRASEFGETIDAPAQDEEFVMAHSDNVGASGRAPRCRVRRRPLRSEEHTSELQSLMRISYAVFCLNKKKERDNATT